MNEDPLTYVFEQVESGLSQVIMRDGKRVGILVPWDQWQDMQEALARLDKSP